MNTCNFEGVGVGGLHCTFVSVTAVAVTLCLGRALLHHFVSHGFVSRIHAVFEYQYIFLGLSTWRMILIRLTYKNTACAEKTVTQAHLCVTGVN